MGLRYYKSINLGGGLRISLSKSGIGYSWGMKGYRVTKTAKGTVRQTVSIPGTGISYTSETKSRKNDAVSVQSEVDYGYKDLTKVQTADIENLQPASYKDVFLRAKVYQLMFIILVFFAALFLVQQNNLLARMAFFIAVVVRLFLKVHLYYDFDEVCQEKWNAQYAAWSDVVSCKKLWQVNQTATSTSVKKSAGAKTLAGIKDIKPGKRLPWFLKSDVKPVVLELEDESIAILPDRILLFQKKKLGYYACGAAAYDDVKFTFGIRPFGDPDGPSITDAEQMGSTWEKVNKDGSPDLRFAGNCEIPIMKYGEVRMQSQSGLNVWLMCSRVPPVETLENTYQ